MVKTLNLNSFYEKINTQIKTTAAYAEIESLEFIIKSCRLKPYPKNSQANHYKKWIDEYHNSYCINDNKIFKETYNDLEIDVNMSTSDLYYGLPLDKIYKISKMMFLYIGKDEETREDLIVISFLGIDNYWRAYYIQKDEIMNCSPLVIGFDMMDDIYKNLDIKYYTEIKVKQDIILECDCDTDKAWLSYCPPHQDFLDVVKEHNEFAYEFLLTVI